MTARHDTDRVIALWLTEIAPEGRVDYLDETLGALDRVRQRPAWASPRRWLPVQMTLPRVVVPRAAPYLALLALLLIGVLVALLVAGGQRRLPVPFGPAANGVVAYSKDGDIYTVDPTTGARRAVVTGAATDESPAFSRDGTRLAFIRSQGSGSVVVLADADGRNQVDVQMSPLANVGSLTWSPDGRSIAVVADDTGDTGSVWIVDTTVSSIRKVDVVSEYEEVQWRPPDGRQLLVTARVAGRARFALVSTVDDTVEILPTPDGDPAGGLRPGDWSLDGRRFLYAAPNRNVQILDFDGGPQVVIVPSQPAEGGGYPRFSNDRRQVLFMEWGQTSTWLSVGPSDGSKPAIRVSDIYAEGMGTHYVWAPDDRTIAFEPNLGPRVLLDPAGGRATTPPWLTESVESWQRLAP
jgi:dipeptidyl aminopeptidase/acylaminoacyl peptidase